MRDLAELRFIPDRKPRRPLDPQDVAQFEAASGFTLPADYVAFLRFQNGGSPGLDTTLPKDPGRSPWAVGVFFHLGSDREEPDGLWQALSVWRPGLGHRTLPIGEDPGGNVFFLDFGEASVPVKVWVHDEAGPALSLASTFAAFVDGLCEDPEA